MELKDKIHQYLLSFHQGRHRPIKAVDLADVFHVEIRGIAEAIRQLRLDKILIGSSKEKPYGYYIPATEQEIKDYLDTYREELFDMLQIHNVQKRAARIALEKLHQPEFKVDAGQYAFI